MTRIFSSFMLVHIIYCTFLQQISSKSHYHHTEENRGVEEVGATAKSIASMVGLVRILSIAVFARETASLWVAVVR
jgi:hypothetical protein